jgi:hypothetical protein
MFDLPGCVESLVDFVVTEGEERRLCLLNQLLVAVLLLYGRYISGLGAFEAALRNMTI